MFSGNNDYDSDGSDFRYVDLDNDEDQAIAFDLHEQVNDPAAVQQGQLRSYEARENSTVLYYYDSPSDYSVLVDRLLWVDGYEHTDESGNNDGREMTLVVLKIAVSSSDPESKVKSFTASLSLKDKLTDGKHEPIAEAWAPFRRSERWNESSAQRETTRTTDIGTQAGYGGVQVSASRSRENKLSWEKVDFDEGQSRELISRKTQRRNGVQWSLTQNSLLNQGVVSEVWVAVLFSRSSSQSYGVKFTFEARAGTLDNLEQKTKRLFRTKPNETKGFLVTPARGPKAVEGGSEGANILQAIDPNNLGKLRVGTELVLPLHCTHQAPPLHLTHQAPEPMGEETVGWGAEGASILQAIDPTNLGTLRGADRTELIPPLHRTHQTAEPTPAPDVRTPLATPAKPPKPIAARAAQPADTQPADAQPADAQTADAQPMACSLGPAYSHGPAYPHGPACSLGPACSDTLSLSRLTLVEGRLAQAEARLAAQDSIILDLRRAMFNLRIQSLGQL